MYSIGGWITMPASCSRGFRSWPSAGAGNTRSNGLEVNSVNIMKPQLTSPMTPSTRASMRWSSCREKTDTAIVQPERIRVHSRIEPSWLPHTAVMRKISGRFELEWLAASATEKSLVTNACVRQA